MTAVLEPCGCTTDTESGKPVTLCAECKQALGTPDAFQHAGDVAREIVTELLAQSQGRAA